MSHSYLALPRCPCRVLPHCWVLGRTYAAQHSSPIARLSPCTGTPPPPTHKILRIQFKVKNKAGCLLWWTKYETRSVNMYFWQESLYIYVPLVGYQARSVFGAVPTFISLESLCSLRVYKKKNITLNFLFLNLGECILQNNLCLMLIWLFATDL